MQNLTLKGRTIVEGHCKAKALVSKKPLSFLGGVDPSNGKITERDHDLYGECIKGKILCFPQGHGSTVGSYVLYSLAKKGLAPKAIINQTADPVIAVGAIIADIPMIDKIDLKRIKNGDLIEVDAGRGFIRVLKRKES